MAQCQKARFGAPMVCWRSTYVPPTEYMLALKLLAGRPRDIADIQALSQQLAITSREQAQQVVDRYIPDQTLQLLSHLDLTLHQLFP